jgi:Transglycosylase-like domain
MPAAPRHAKRKVSAVKRGAPIVAAATLAGVAAAFVSLHGGSAAPAPSDFAAPVTNAGSAGLTSDRVATTVHSNVATLEARIVRQARRAARSRHLAALAAARRAQQAQPATPPPSQATAPAPPPSSGGDAANSPLGVCIRDAEEGGSYAWGPGNGGGAYQFQLSTWENYGGAASEYGVAGPAYQDQIFDNAIAAGGASNWTNYDGC